jgi:tetratricopeptide (TPR) repeat protein
MLVMLLLFPSAAIAQEAPPRAIPVAPPQLSRKAALDQALAMLRAAPSEDAATVMEAQIAQMWVEAGSPAVTLLMARGMRDQQAGSNEDALADFDSAIALDPSLAEGYRRRAHVRFEIGDVDGALADLGETLAHEPREFLALQDLSHVAEAQGNWKGALAAWEKVLELDPKTAGAEERRAKLERKALGQAL